MRLFQNSGLYPSYLAHLNQLAAEASSFEGGVASSWMTALARCIF